MVLWAVMISATQGVSCPCHLLLDDTVAPEPCIEVSLSHTLTLMPFGPCGSVWVSVQCAWCFCVEVKLEVVGCEETAQVRGFLPLSTDQ